MQAQGKEIHLLVVDDDESVRALLQLQLEAAGYQVATAIHGAEALDQIRITAPDLVISDILMPELDGFGLCRALRADPRLRQIPVIFLTAHYLDAEDVELGQRLGAVRFIIKSNCQEELLNAIKEGLENNSSVPNVLALRFPELAELACELHLQRLYAQLSKKVQQLVDSETRLSLSEARYRNILDSAPDSIVVSDQQGCITLVNQQTETLLGYSREELIGQPLELLISPDLATEHRSNRNRFLASPLDRLEKRQVLGLPARCKNGDTVPVEINLGSLSQEGEVTVTAIIRDIRERLRAEQKIQHLNRVYQLLSQCNQALVKANLETELLHAFCHNIVETGGYAMAWVGYAEPDQQPSFRVAAGVNEQPPSLEHSVQHCGQSCPVCRVLAQGKVIVVDPQDLNSAQRQCLGLGSDSTISHAMVLPLTRNNRVFGVLTINAASQIAFADAEELRLLNELASDLSYGINTLRRGVAKQQAEAALHLRERALDASRNGILLIDVLAENYPVVYVNPAVGRITGYDLEDLQEECLSLLAGQDSDQHGLGELIMALQHRTATETVLRNYRQDGSQFWNEIRISPVPDESGAITHMVMVISDISERMAYQTALEHRSNHDLLTQLPNRNLLNDRLEQALVQAHRHQYKSAVLFIDLDRFKNINESLGLLVGDQLVREIARRLSGQVHEGDTVSRWGGDEFVLVLPDINSREEVAEIGRRIVAEVARPVEIEQQTLMITCSVGCSIYPDDDEQADSLLKYADAAMYQAKKLGGNRFQFFEQAFNLAVQARFSIESALRQALDDQQLQIYYQPVVALKTGRICSAEALIRWNHPQRGLMLPGQFIPIAEETGLIVEIGNQVIDKVCSQLEAWQERGLELDSIAINMAAKQFSMEDMHSTLALRVAAAGLKPSAIEIELTETVLIQDQPVSYENMRQLKKSGFSLSLDDFGTGYSSLSYLRKFPVNRIKIDQSFIRDLTTDPGCGSLVVTILSMAQTLGCEVIAEGVETESQLQFLKREGCDYGQGYYFSPPLPAEQFERLLHEGKSLPAEDQSAVFA